MYTKQFARYSQYTLAETFGVYEAMDSKDIRSRRKNIILDLSKFISYEYNFLEILNLKYKLEQLGIALTLCLVA